MKRLSCPKDVDKEREQRIRVYAYQILGGRKPISRTPQCTLADKAADEYWVQEQKEAEILADELRAKMPGP